MMGHAMEIWASGGWLMVPLLILTVFIYGTALNLLLHLQCHFLLRGKVHQLSLEDLAVARDEHMHRARQLICFDTMDVEDIRRHFVEVRNEYVPYVDRRIRFLAIIITAGPLIGLLGTVTGMLSTFSGMIGAIGSRFQNIVSGISEALITTQAGLIISIPAMVILSLIIHRRNALVLAISRLERYNVRLVLRAGCPIPRARSIHSRPA